MSQMSGAQARVADPILTAVARGYVSPKSPLANVLFPVVSVGSRAGHIISFGADDFRVVNTARAPGADIKRVQFGYAGDKYSLVDHDLEGVLPIEIEEEAAAVPGIAMGSVTVKKVLNMMGIERENQAAKIATNAGNYDSSNKSAPTSTDKWDHADSNPAKQIEDAKEVVRSQIGAYPNVLALSPKAYTALRNHPKLLDRISTATDRAPLNTQQLAALLEVDRVVVGDGVAFDDATKKFVDLWGKDAVLAYTQPASLAEMGSPCFGYTYQLGEGPAVSESYFVRGKKSWIYPVADAYQPVLAGKSAAFLFKGVV